MTNRTASNRTSEFQIAYAVILYLQTKRSGRRAATWTELRTNLRHFIQQPFTDADREKRGNGAIKWHTVLTNISAHEHHPDNPCQLGILRVIPEGGLELLDDDLTKPEYRAFMRLAQWQGPQDITEDDRRKIVQWIVRYLTENVKPLVSEVRTAAEQGLAMYDWPLIEDVAKKNVKVRTFNTKKQRWELVQKELTRLNKADSGFKLTPQPQPPRVAFTLSHELRDDEVMVMTMLMNIQNMSPQHAIMIRDAAAARVAAMKEGSRK